MEEFKSKIKKRIFVFKCYAFVGSFVVIYEVFGGVFDALKSGDFKDGMVEGESFGIMIAIAIMAVIQIIRLSRVLNDETQLKMLYNKEHDERLKAIRSKAGMPMIMIMSILMFAAGIVGSYFNEVVFYTLFAAGFVQLTIGAILKIYYLKKL